MAWSPVPFAVGSGAVVQVEEFRLVPYLALGGKEGVAAAGDCAVLQLAAPGAGVRVMPGAVAMLNRGASVTTYGQQTYLDRNAAEEVVAIAPTGVGVTRYDLIAVVVEDPQYAGQPAPASVANGPYVRTKVYSNVPSTTKTLADVDPAQTGLALALVKMNPSTTIPATITDLRVLVRPRQETFTRYLNMAGSAVNLTSGAMTEFPTGASWDLPIPAWAQTAHIRADVANLRVTNDATDAGDWLGQARVKLGTMVTQTITVRPAPPAANKTDNFGYLAADQIAVPADHRGTTKTLTVQALRTSATSGVTVAHDSGSLVAVQVVFVEDVNATGA